MSRRAVFIPYEPKTILNKAKRADHWFWTRYSAYPYLGCQHGCEFCYCRERKYAPHDDPLDFAYMIKVKTNAPALLRRALSRAPLDVVGVGDYQPAERKFALSRQMLEVCAELGFPVLVLSRSPLVLRDLDVLQTIRARAAVTVAFSIISAPGSPSYERVCQMEHLAPPAARRLAAMEQLARAGITVGACCMPIVPGLCDTDANLQAVVRQVADHGGRFVLAGGLTLADQQRAYFLNVLHERFPEWLALYTRLYPEGSYSPVGWGWPQVASRIRELCLGGGLADRMPRPIVAGDKRALNKRIVEALANRIWALELEAGGRARGRAWAYRRAAWAIEDLPQDIALIYAQLGAKGVESIPAVGPGLAREMIQLMKSLSAPAAGDESKPAPDGGPV
jgi:DNA repair photolyase